MTKPNFLIVGVARCGTTSLYKYLSQHPDICFSEQKEPKFFSSLDLSFPLNGRGDLEVQNEMIRTEQEYFDSFSQCKSQVIGEASSDYFYFHEKTIPRIKQYLGDVKIIIVLRNPFERSFSAYSNMIRDSREELSFYEGLLKENLRKNCNYDWMWFYRSGSLFAEGVKNFIDNFSHVHIVFNADLANNTQHTLKQCFAFLGVKEDFVPFDLTKYSHSGRPKNRMIKFFARRSGITYILRRFLIRVIPRNYLELVARNVLTKGEIDDRAMNLLRDELNSDISNLEQVLAKDLSKWKK
jgi:hypothetical protein